MTTRLVGKRIFSEAFHIEESTVVESIRKENDELAAAQIKKIPTLTEGLSLFQRACQMGLTESAVALAEKGYSDRHILKSALTRGHIELIRRVMRVSPVARSRNLLFLLPDYVPKSDPWNLSSPVDIPKSDRIRFYKAVDKAARECISQLDTPDGSLAFRWGHLGHPSFEVEGSEKFKKTIKSLTRNLLKTKTGFNVLRAIEKRKEKIYIHESTESRVGDLHLYLNPNRFVEMLHLIDRKGEAKTESNVSIIFLHELSHILLRVLENDRLRQLNGIHPCMENLEEQLAIMYENFYRFETQRYPAYRDSHLDANTHEKNYLLADLLVTRYKGMDFILLDRLKSGGTDITEQFRDGNNLLHLLLKKVRFTDCKLIDQIGNLIDRGVRADQADGEGITPLQMMQERLTPKDYARIRREMHVNDLFSFCQS